jgi:hypothetical protein
MVDEESGATGEGDRSRMRAVKEVKGGGVGEGKSVEVSSSSVAAKRSVRSSNSAIWCIRRWMCGTSLAEARRSSAHTSPEKVVEQGAAAIWVRSQDSGCVEKRERWEWEVEVEQSIMDAGYGDGVAIGKYTPSPSLSLLRRGN